MRMYVRTHTYTEKNSKHRPQTPTYNVHTYAQMYMYVRMYCINTGLYVRTLCNSR